MKYLVVIEEDQEGFGAYVPDLPGCVSVGTSPEEVLGAMVVVGVLDVRQYGTMGSPTSIKTVGLVLVLFAAAVYWKRLGSLR